VKRFGAALAFATILFAACGAQDGTGKTKGTLDIKDCWTGDFDLAPDYFAAMPYRNAIQIRLQRGSDFETFADGLVILVNDTSKIRPGPGFAGRYNQDLPVSLPPGVVPPGTPIKATPDPAPVHMNVYLQRTCRTLQVSLYAVDGVLLEADETCGQRVATPLDCSSTATPRPVGRSTIRFTHLPSGNIEDSNAAERLVEGSFDIYLADPREGCGSGLGPPPCRGHLSGEFRFYYDRTKPAQPFP